MTTLRAALAPILVMTAVCVLIAVSGFGFVAAAQTVPDYDNLDQTQAALAEARTQQAAAARRAAQLEQSAAAAVAAADRTARQAAAIAARIQESEAGIAAQQAQIAMIARQRGMLRAALAERQRPVVQLTAALQRLSRRPLVLSLLRPGSVRETAMTRALLETMLPEVARRTRTLRSELARGRVLEAQARGASQALRGQQTTLASRRQALAAIETRQRLASRAASGDASRETERALALAEQARDLSSLVGDLARAGSLRAALAALPGPVMRPPRPDQSQVIDSAAAGLATGSVAPAQIAGYILPVAGRLVTGFGEGGADAPRSRGVGIAARSGALVVAPAAGRVAFAGAYRGFGTIVIIEHDGGWTSLVTGLARADVAVGDTIVAGAPLGIAGGDTPMPVIGLELRREGIPVNPLDQVGSR